MNKPTIYLVPGLATDNTIFRNIKFAGYNTVCLEWIDPIKGESLTDFAFRFGNSIDTSAPFVLLGVSMGGIVATEMTKFYAPTLLVLISTIKNHKELPWYLRIFILFPIYKIVPFSWCKWGIKRIRIVATKMPKKDLLLFTTMIDKASGVFFRWAIHQVLFWKNNGYIGKAIHIHGSADKLFPIRYIHQPIIIEGGNHFMIIQRGKEIEQIVLNAIESL